MGRSWVSAVGRVRLVTISAAVAFVLAGLALHGSASTGGATFRDIAYGPAPTHHIKLTGVVKKKTTCMPSNCGRVGGPGTLGKPGAPLYIIWVYKRSKKVGQMIVAPPDCAGNQCPQGGTGKLSVGGDKRKAQLALFFKLTFNCIIGTQGCRGTPPKFSTGTFGTESIRAPGAGIPTGPIGKHFKFTLGY